MRFYRAAVDLSRPTLNHLAAVIRSWKLLRKLRCSPGKAGHLVKAIAVLQNYQVTRGRKG